MGIKVTVIGYGNVGRVLTALLLGSNRSMELNILDPADWLSGAFLDLKHALGMQPNKQVYFNSQELFENSDYVFFTAGIPSKHGASRLTTVKDNTQLVKDIFHGKNLNPKMSVIAITNPVDVITAAIYKYSSLPWHQVMGTGTYLDSERFSYYLVHLTGTNDRNISALILGEHGESCAPILSASTYQDKPLMESKVFTSEITEKALYQTHHAAFEIRKTEPGTSMAVSHCALRMMEYLQEETERNIPASVMLSSAWVEKLGLKHTICMSVPVVLSSKGLQIPEPLEMKNGELSALRRSAQVLLEYQEFLAY
ncbi:MAG: malate dehydrogenase [Fluviicola sp.]